MGWLEKCRARAARRVSAAQGIEVPPPANATATNGSDAPSNDVSALFAGHHSSWSYSDDDGYVVFQGEFYNPTDQWLTYVEALVTFQRETKEGYVLASRLVELRVIVPPRESRPFRIVPEPGIDFRTLDGKVWWDYEVTRAEVGMHTLPDLFAGGE